MAWNELPPRSGMEASGRAIRKFLAVLEKRMKFVIIPYNYDQLPESQRRKMIRNQVNGPVETGGKLPYEVLHQQRDILNPLPQGRKVDRNDVQAVVQVCSKLLVRHQLRKVLVGRCDHPNVDPNRLAAAQALEFLFPQGA
jgi:hypothetical protein